MAYSAHARPGTGTEPPVPEWVEVSQSLYRCFAFIDVCDFTRFTARNGTLAAIDVLTRFRAACRDATGRRGVRVTKWLGDGAMIVGTSDGPVIAAAAELLLRFRGDAFEIHGGIAGGSVLLFEGDDYIGRSVNLAARLCGSAEAGRLLSVGLDDEVPSWVAVSGHRCVDLAGIGRLEATELSVTDDAWAIEPPKVPFPTSAG